MEHDLGACRPDIALIDMNGRVVAAIEIVVSHQPEMTAIEYYTRERIPLLIFRLKSDLELRRAKDEILAPDSNDACLNQRCKRCHDPMMHQKLLIRHGKCWKCQSRISISEVRCDTGDAGVITDEIIKAAAQEGSYIRLEAVGRSIANRYDANVCPKCNATIGDRPPLTGIILEANCPCLEFDAGYYCRKCGNV